MLLNLKLFNLLIAEKDSDFNEGSGFISTSTVQFLYLNNILLFLSEGNYGDETFFSGKELSSDEDLSDNEEFARILYQERTPLNKLAIALFFQDPLEDVDFSNTLDVLFLSESLYMNCLF